MRLNGAGGGFSWPGHALALAALAWTLAGCGGRDPYAGYDPDDAATMKRISRLKSPKLTLTMKELEMTYPEKAWDIVSEPFEPKYRKIAERDVFEWAYLEELSDKRRALLARARKERAALARRALVRRKKAQQKKDKAEAAARARAKREAALEAAGKRETVPPAKKPPATP